MMKKRLEYFGDYDHNDYWRRFKCDNDNFQWISEDESILTVENGTIKPKSPGNTKVKAIAPNGDIIMTDVYVSDGDATVELNVTELTMYVGDTYQLEATVNSKFSDVNHIDRWGVLGTGTKCVSIDDNGLVTALRTGTRDVYVALANGKIAKCTINVLTAYPIKEITLNKSNLSLVVGETEKLEATIKPSYTTNDKTITWKSSNPKVAEVDKNGNITAKGEGTITITATTSNGITANCEVEVTKYLKGDVDNDKRISIKDVKLALQYSLSKVELTETRSESSRCE